MLIENSSVFIKAKMMQRFRDSNQKELRVQDIQYLQTVKDQRIEKITISIDSDSLKETLVNDLDAVLNENRGNVQLYFQIRDNETNRPITLHAKSFGVNASHALISFIEGQPNMEYRIN